MKRFDNIQILRVAACLGVFMTHLAPRMGLTGWMAAAANFGASGVYLFFMISGFLACSKESDILSYYGRRLLRVLPLYYVVILYNMVLHGLILKDVPTDPAGLSWLRYFLLTNAVIPAPDNFWGNLTATWTVSLFVFFYLCAPFLNRLIAKVGKTFSGRYASVVCTALLYLAALLLRDCWVAAGLSSYMMAFYYLHFFLLGMLVRQLLICFGPVRGAGSMAVFAVFLYLVQLLSGRGTDYFTCLSWGFAVLILLTGHFSWKRDENGKPGRFAGIVGCLDEYSYAIYLVHAVVIDGIGLLQAHSPFRTAVAVSDKTGSLQVPGALEGAIVFLTAVVLTAVGAYAAHRLIEKPAEKLSRRLVRARGI